MKTITTTLLLAALPLITHPLAAADDSNAIAMRHRMIENAYTQSLSLLNEQALRCAASIPTVDRLLWADFLRLRGAFPDADRYFTDTAGDFVQNPRAFRLRTIMVDSYFLTAAAKFFLDPNALAIVENLVADATEPYALSRCARALLPAMRDLNLQVTQLQSRHKRALARLDVQSTALVPAFTKPSRTSPPSVVKAIELIDVNDHQ
jgi:hypothetical protein